MRRLILQLAPPKSPRARAWSPARSDASEHALGRARGRAPKRSPKHAQAAQAALLALMSAWALSACTPTITCEDVGCAYGQSCDTVSGRCQVLTRDCRRDPTICRADQSCDASSGSCLSKQVSCVSQQTCPLGQVCNAQTGICQNLGSCRSDRDCSVGQRCDVDSGRCQSRQCARSRDCGAGLVCDLTIGRCSPGCDDEVPCAAEALCLRAPEAPLGTCLTTCGVDTDCNFGRYCNLLKTPPACDPEPPCEDDAGCRADEVCREGICGRPPCAASTDCGPGQVCDGRSGVCLGEGCAEDAFSPNHGPAMAAALEPGAFVQLSRCPGSADWFVLTMQSGELLRIEASHDAAQTLELTLMDQERRVLRASSLAAAQAAIEHQATRDQRVWLRVDSPSLARVEYALRVTRRQIGSCLDDPLEENDTATTATALNLTPGAAVVLPIALCPGDEDWFDLGQLQAPWALHVTLETTQDKEATLWLYGPRGEVWARRADEPLDWARVGEPGRYLLRLLPGRATVASAQLRASLRADSACPEQDSDNHAPAKASPLERGALSAHVLCVAPSALLSGAQDAWEEDWYALEPVSAAQRLTLRLARPNPEGTPLEPTQLEVALFRVEGDGTPRFWRAAALEPGGTYGLAATLEPGVMGPSRWLVKVGAAGKPRRVWSWPLYQLTYRYDAP